LCQGLRLEKKNDKKIRVHIGLSSSFSNWIWRENLTKMFVKFIIFLNAESIVTPKILEIQELKTFVKRSLLVLLLVLSVGTSIVSSCNEDGSHDDSTTNHG